MQSFDYTGIVGCLNWVALTCRPDVAHAASLMSSLVGNLGKRHWNAAKGNLRHLKVKCQRVWFFKKK